MLDQKMIDAWVHLEVIEEAGWFKNLLHGNAPFLEVALAREDYFELNLGKLKSEIASRADIPSNWKSEKQGLYRVPILELPLLVKWIDDFFNHAVGEIKERRLAGWLDGF